VTAKVNDRFRIFPFIDSYAKHLDKEGLGYVYIRVADRLDRNKNVNLSVYLSNGERLKLKPSQMEKGRVHNGMHETQRNIINGYLDTLTNKLLNHTLEGFKEKDFSKVGLETFLYEREFLNTHKKARTKLLALPVYQIEPKPEFEELRQEYPKSIEKVTTNTVNAKGFREQEIREVVIDPLSLKEFPKNFSPELYKQFEIQVIEKMKGIWNDEVVTNITLSKTGEPIVKESPMTPKIIAQRVKELQGGDRSVLNSYIKNEIERKYFKQAESKIIIKKDIRKKFEQEHGKIELNQFGRPTLVPSKRKALLEIKKIQDHSMMTTEEIYKKDLWNHENIFEMFGSIYYDDTTNDTYCKIVLRLMEYREHAKPPEHIKDFNVDWLNNFFAFIKKNGWYHINTKNFDPLKYDANIFFQKKTREPYKAKSYNKMIGMVKALVLGGNTVTTIPFWKKGYISKMDLSELKTDKSEQKGTRIDHNLTKEELDKLYWYPFEKKNLSKYQEHFDKANNSKSVTISIQDLDTARKLFVLQVAFGGLRGWKELSTAKMIRYDKGYAVSFFQNKVTNTITNPLNDYSEKILKPLGYKMPVLNRTNTHDNSKAVANVDAMEQYYRALLKTVAMIIRFDREVLVDNAKFLHKTVQDLFNPYFARKTWGQILYDKLRLRESEIVLFTGHKDKNETELGQSYINKKSIEKKLELISKLKVGRNPYK
jgi:hypothetical protein